MSPSTGIPLNKMQQDYLELHCHLQKGKIGDASTLLVNCIFVSFLNVLCIPQQGIISMNMTLQNDAAEGLLILCNNLEVLYSCRLLSCY